MAADKLGRVAVNFNLGVGVCVWGVWGWVYVCVGGGGVCVWGGGGGVCLLYALAVHVYIIFCCFEESISVIGIFL